MQAVRGASTVLRQLQLPGTAEVERGKSVAGIGACRGRWPSVTWSGDKKEFSSFPSQSLALWRREILFGQRHELLKESWGIAGVGAEISSVAV